MFKIVLDILLRTLNIEVFRFTGLEKTGNLSCLICKRSHFVYIRGLIQTTLSVLLYILSKVP